MIAMRRLSPLLTALLLAAALLARLLVPGGWMPVIDASGAVRVAICTGAGPTTITLHTDPAGQPEAPRDPCPYGLAGAQALAVPPPPALPLAPAALALLLLPALLAARLVAWRAMRPPARGPPVFA